MIPSIEYLRGPEYCAVPDMAIVSEGPVASVSLWKGLLSHDFNIQYVWAYTARNLPTPYTAQPNGYTCGPTSVHMALALHNASPGIWALARELGTTTEGTGPTPIVTQALRNHTGAPYETTTIPWNGGAVDPADTRRLWDNVVEDVDGGYAIVAYVYAPAHEYPYHDVAYPLEHYFVVDGYDTSYGTVRISDPANFSGRSRFWITVDQLAYLIAGTPGYAW